MSIFVSAGTRLIHFRCNAVPPSLAAESEFALSSPLVCAPAIVVPYCYVVTSDHELELRRWDEDSSSFQAVAAFNTPPTSILSFNNKVYALCAEALVAFDPLSLKLEYFPLQCAAVEFSCTGDGFVLVDADRRALHTFSCVHGVAPVSLEQPSRGPPFGVLGSLNRRAFIRCGSGEVFSVSSGGSVECVDLDTLRHVPRHPFVVADAAPIVVSFDPIGQELLINGTAVPLDGSGASPPLVLVDVRVVLCAVPMLEPVDTCPICLGDWSDGPSVTFDCGHRFHIECVQYNVSRQEEYVEQGEHVTFVKGLCPGGCGIRIRDAEVNPRFAAITQRFNDTLDAAKSAGAVPDCTAADDMLFYMCFACSKPFFGGLRHCPRMDPQEPPKAPSDLICDGCRTDDKCPLHGRDFAVYKCTYCCNPATHRCFGNRYACSRCEALWTTSQEPAVRECVPAWCPLGGSHRSGGSYPIGCWNCLPTNAIGIEKIAAN